MKKELVVIGGGYGGLKLISKLKNDFHITLIDKNEEHIEQTEIHRYLAGKIDLDELTFLYEEFSHKRGIDFLQAEVSNINFEEKYVSYGENRIKYDHLVVSTGSNTFFPKQIQGLDQYKKDIKSLDVIKKFKSDFDQFLKDSTTKRNIMIAGGGLSGIEIAIELAEKIKNKNLENNIKVTIVEQQPTILPGSNEYLINKTKEVLANLGVICVHGEFITEVKEDKVVLGNKEQINYDLSLFVLGVSSISVPNEQNIEVNVKQQYVVNEYFQIEPYEDAFCIGDAAQTYTPDGKYNLPTGQMANMQAEVLAENLINSIEDKGLVKKNLMLKGVLVDLGKKDAVGLIMNKFKISGYVAYLLKRFTSYLHKTKFYY